MCAAAAIAAGVWATTPLSSSVFTLLRNTVDSSTAAQRKSQSAANLVHPSVAQAGDALSNTLLRDCDSVVQVDGAASLHSVLNIQNHLGRYVSNRGGDRRHGDSCKMADGAVASQQQNWPLFIGAGESAKVDIAAAQSFGHAAASSQRRYS